MYLGTKQNNNVFTKMTKSCTVLRLILMRKLAMLPMDSSGGVGQSRSLANGFNESTTCDVETSTTHFPVPFDPIFKKKNLKNFW